MAQGKHKGYPPALTLTTTTTTHQLLHLGDQLLLVLRQAVHQSLEVIALLAHARVPILERLQLRGLLPVLLPVSRQLSKLSGQRRNLPEAQGSRTGNMHIPTQRQPSTVGPCSTGCSNAGGTRTG
jgi:hypothetical protein